MVIEVAEDDDGGVRAVTVDQPIGHAGRTVAASAARRVERVRGVPLAFALVPRLEPSVGQAEELGLQMAGDQVQWHSRVTDGAYTERTAAHAVVRATEVVSLHGLQAVGKRRFVDLDLELAIGEKPDPDAAVVRQRRQRAAPAGAEHIDEGVEHAGVADLLDRQHADTRVLDRCRERCHLEVELFLRLGPVVRPGQVEVLEVPRTDDHHLPYTLSAAHRNVA